MKNTNKRTLIGYGLVSPLHLANFMAHYYSSPYNYERLIIFIYNYWGSNILPEYYLKYLNDNSIEVIYSNNLKELKHVIKKEVNDIELVLVSNFNWKVIARTSSKVKYVTVIDEGLSSYRSFSSLKADNPNLKLYKIILSKILSRLTTSILSKERAKFKMFDIDSLKINPLYRKGLFQYFESLKHFVDSNDNKNFSNTILYCSQPWVELNVMSEQDYIEYINQIKTNIENQGSEFMLKKHPAEHVIDYDAHKISTLDDNRMLEEIIYTTKFKAIISRTSTSSFLVPALFDIESYLINLDDIKSLGRDASRLFEKYCQNIDSQ